MDWLSRIRHPLASRRLAAAAAPRDPATDNPLPGAHPPVVPPASPFGYGALVIGVPRSDEPRH